MRSKTKHIVLAHVLVERLEVRQLLSAAVHAAADKVATAHRLDATITDYHKGNHPKGRRLGLAREAAAAAAGAVSPAASGATPATVTPGLIDAVYHGDAAYTTTTPATPVPNPDPNPNLNNGVLGGDNAAVARTVAYVASHSPNYTFVNSSDSFVYGNDSSTITGTFLGTDAAGAALTDPANVNDTIFDAEGYFLTPSANDGGTYYVTLGGVDDLVAVYMGGNGTPGSGTLVASNGWQGANAGLPGFSINIPNAADSSQPASVPIEILFGNGFGGAGLSAVGGSSPNTSVQIIDSGGNQVASFQTTPTTNEVLPTAPSLSAVAGNNSVILTWGATFAASSYSVYRYNANANPNTAVQLATGLTATTYTDNTAVNGTTYDYYVTADNAGGSTPSNTVSSTPTSSPTGPVTDLTVSRTGANTVQLSFTAPPFGTNYTITRSTTLGGTQTTLTPVGGQTATTFTDTNAPATSNYYYTVTSVNGAGSSTPVVGFIGMGDGWAADYYTSNTADPGRTGNTKPLSGDDPTSILAFERIDSTINFTGGDNTPPPNTPPGFNSIQAVNGNPGDDYAIRWTGYVEAPVTGYYSFGVNGVDDREQITVYDPNHLTSGQPTPVNISPAGHVMTGFDDTYTVPVVGTDSQPYLFTAGQPYLVQVDYNQGYGGAIANLSFEASTTTANQTAGTYDALPQTLVPQADVLAPVPAFTNVDAAGPVTKDQSYFSFTASGGPTQVRLTWNNVNADSYNLYRATSQAGPYTKVNSSPITASANGAPVVYTDGGLTNGTTYYYILTGVDVSGETAINTANGTTAGMTASAAPANTAPAAPADVLAGGTTGASNVVQGRVGFDSVPFTSSYIIQRAPESSPGSGTPGTFATVPGGGAVPTTSGPYVFFTDTDPSLNSTTNYFYRVIAVGGGLQSTPSATAEMAATGAALASEGTVEVDVRAAGAGSGSTNGILNLAGQVGEFPAVGGAITTGTVTDANSKTYEAFQFNGSDSASSTFNAPADLTGNSTRSIELWVNNPTIDGVEESMVSWARRGGNPDGSNMSFSYGNTYGVGLWGGEYDLEWTQNTAPGVTAPGTAPAANTWHYLVFTYDGTNCDVYVDGQLYLQRGVANGGLQTVAGLPVNLAAQNSTGVSGYIAAITGSLDLASVRISAGALTQADVTNNFNAGVPGQAPVSALPGYITASSGAAYTYNSSAGTLSLTSGTLTFTADEASNVPSYGPPLAVTATGAGASLVFQTGQHLAGLTLAGGATAVYTGPSTGTLTLSGALTISGAGSTMDLGSGSLLVPTTANVAAYIAQAAGAVQANGLNAWNGVGGLTSGAVKADAANGNAEQLALGYYDSRDNGNTGLSVPAGMTLVKYTVYGDATGDGKVSIADLSVWNNNFGAASPRWSEGDFNYDGKVNIADLSVWNNDFGNKAPTL